MGLATDAVAALVASGSPLPAAQVNALKKEYDFAVTITIKEHDTGQGFFDAENKWTGLSYPIVVVLEDHLIQLLVELNKLGKAIATGQPPQ